MQVSYDTVIYQTLMCTFAVPFKFLARVKSIFSMYGAYLFPPSEQWFDQSKISSNSNGLCTSAARVLAIGTVLIVAPSSKIYTKKSVISQQGYDLTIPIYSIQVINHCSTNRITIEGLVLFWKYPCNVNDFRQLHIPFKINGKGFCG